VPPAVDTSLDSRSDFGLPEMTDGADCSPSTRGRIIVDQGMVPTAKGAQALDRVSPMQHCLLGSLLVVFNLRQAKPAYSTEDVRLAPLRRGTRIGAEHRGPRAGPTGRGGAAYPFGERIVPWVPAATGFRCNNKGALGSSGKSTLTITELSRREDPDPRSSDRRLGLAADQGRPCEEDAWPIVTTPNCASG
jgi:hypothetical protein